jgi:putative SOS response-associated peptidase YedK
MCGRYTLSKKEHLEQMLREAGFVFDEFSDIRLVPRFNIAPSQQIPVILDEAPRTITSAKWGLIPSWAKDEKIAGSLTNARAETVMEKPAFRTAFRKRRCWVPADGFYEWKKTPIGKQPYRFTMKDESLFFFAGLWEIWRNTEGKDVRTVTLITTEPNEVTQFVHDRMPVILAPANRAAWLAKETPVETLKSLLVPYSADTMQAMPVSTAVNSAKYDGPELIKPLASPGEFRLEG